VRRSKQPDQVVRLSAPDEYVTAMTDVYQGSHCVTRGTRVRRDHPFVIGCPEAFLVSYTLDQERREEVTDDGK
jgi:hypothetical protein